MTPPSASESLEQWAKGSKIVAPSGALLPVFHGTEYPEDFDRFRPHGNSYLGIYASADRAYAESFGEHVKMLWFALRNPFQIDLNDRASPHFATLHGEISLDGSIVGFYRHLEPASIRALTDRGYDGIVANYRGAKFFEVVAFDPEQVRRATPEEVALVDAEREAKLLCEFGEASPQCAREVH